MFTLKNDLLKITIRRVGAELQKITSVKNGLEFMWDGDPNIWASYAPNLFPIVGRLKDGEYSHGTKNYKLPKHGFARESEYFYLSDKSDNQLRFTLENSKETLLAYPFKFQYSVTYELIKNSIHITYEVKNTDDKMIHFSLGGHPAFKCPIFPDENYDDYSLRFDHPETAPTHLLNLKSGLFNGQTQNIFQESNTIHLNSHLFDNDALVFKNLKSKNVTLESKTHGEILKFNFEDFPFLGIWAKPNADFVCIEPWQGLADYENSSQIFIEKEGMVSLEEKDTFKVSYSIKIHKTHLV